MGKNFMGYNNASELITAIGNKIKAKYSKPSGGIPKSDLATGVQSSLGKADSALQSETDPTVPSWAKASSKPLYTQDEVGDGTTYKRVSSTEKNTWNAKGTYSKPSGGIPKTDLASAVQTSLGLADTSLQHSTVTGSPDLDTYLTTGVYHITTSTATHAPTTNHATLFVDATVGTPYQIFKPDNVDSPWYTRHRSGSSWTAWAAMKFTDTTYSAATTSAAGLMSAADKTKLNGIATGATKTTVDSALSSTSTNPVQNKVINSALTGKASTAVATTSANGLMSSGDKTIVNKLSSNAWEYPTEYNYDVALAEGGFVTIGKLCIIDLKFKTGADIPPNVLFTNFPAPAKFEVLVPIVTIPGSPFSSIKRAMLNYSGELTGLDSIEDGLVCYINLVYVMD